MPVEDQRISLEKYQIIPRVLVFATRGDQLLLIKGASDKKTWPNLFNGIGGHIEQGEDVLSAALREFQEETGLALLNPQLKMIVTIDIQKNPGIGMFVFSGEAGEGDPIPTKEGIPTWVNPLALQNYNLVEDLPHIIPIILNSPPNSPVIFAQYHYLPNGELSIDFSK
ncbi:NUDIX domain-containing protein [bacterium]|nr:NUDIX domain-containing protein [bacterium]